MEIVGCKRIAVVAKSELLIGCGSVRQVFRFLRGKVRPNADCEEHGIEEGRLDLLLHKFGAVSDGGKTEIFFESLGEGVDGIIAKNGGDLGNRESVFDDQLGGVVHLFFMHVVGRRSLHSRCEKMRQIGNAVPQLRRQRVEAPG